MENFEYNDEQMAYWKKGVNEEERQKILSSLQDEQKLGKDNPEKVFYSDATDAEPIMHNTGEGSYKFDDFQTVVKDTEQMALEIQNLSENPRGELGHTAELTNKINELLIRIEKEKNNSQIEDYGDPSHVQIGNEISRAQIEKIETQVNNLKLDLDELINSN